MAAWSSNVFGELGYNIHHLTLEEALLYMHPFAQSHQSHQHTQGFTINLYHKRDNKTSTNKARYGRLLYYDTTHVSTVGTSSFHHFDSFCRTGQMLRSV